MRSSEPFVRTSKRAIRRLSLTFTWLALGFVFNAGCSDDETTSDTVCGGHGELHEDHCHCDPGFVSTDDETSCIPESDSGSEHVHDAGSDHDVDHDHDHDVDPDHDHELDFVPSEVSGATGVADDGSRIWLLEAVDGGAVLSVELYESFGGPTAAGSVDITEEEASYATCGTCLILQTGCVAHDDHVHCEQTFMPRAEGRVHFDELGAAGGEDWSGELLGIVFQEVTIAEDYTTQVVADGDEQHLDEWTFDVVLADLDGGEEECSGHGHLHGDVCHCDTGYQLDPNDSTKCIPE